MHRDWTSVALLQAGLTLTTVSTPPPALSTVPLSDQKEPCPHNVAELIVLSKKTKEEHLLQVPGIEPGTFCVLDRNHNR